MSVKLKDETKEILQDLVSYVQKYGELPDIAELNKAMEDYNISFDEIEDGKFDFVYDYDDLTGFIRSVQSLVDYMKFK